MTHRGYSEADDPADYLDNHYVTLADAKVRAGRAFAYAAVIFGALGVAVGMML